MNAKSRRTLPLILAVVSALLFCLPLLVHNRYYLSILIVVGINTLLALGLTLILGYGGQISLAQAAFYGIGAYIQAILTTRLALSPWLALVPATVATGMVSFALGRAFLRLRGHFLAMATLAFGVVASIVFTQFGTVTGGVAGISNIPPLGLGRWPLDTGARYFYVVVVAVLLTLVLTLGVVESRFGRALEAMRDSEHGAQSCAIDIAYYKSLVFGLGGMWAGLAGALYAEYVLYVSPAPFDYTVVITLLTMSVLGGLGSIWGAVIGAAVVTGLQQAFHSVLPATALILSHIGVRIATSSSEEYDTLVFGLILVVVLLFQPEGIVQLVEQQVRRVARAWGGRRATDRAGTAEGEP